MKQEENREHLGMRLISILLTLVIVALTVECYGLFWPQILPKEELSSDIAANGSIASGSRVQSKPKIPKGEEWQYILVNAKHPLEKGFSVELTQVHGTISVDKRIASALREMCDAAAKDGVSVYPCSGYRSPKRSAQLYKQQVQQYMDKGYSKEDAKKIAARWVAPPGTSEHHTGLAVDLVSNECTVLNAKFAECDAAKWLYKNAADYGFILRYPKDKEKITGIVFEPWHYRYVGVDVAREIMAEGLTLEEYLGAEPVGYERLEVAK